MPATANRRRRKALQREVSPGNPAVNEGREQCTKRKRYKRAYGAIGEILLEILSQIPRRSRPPILTTNKQELKRMAAIWARGDERIRHELCRQTNYERIEENRSSSRASRRETWHERRTKARKEGGCSSPRKRTSQFIVLVNGNVTPMKRSFGGPGPVQNAMPQQTGKITHRADNSQIRARCGRAYDPMLQFPTRVNRCPSECLQCTLPLSKVVHRASLRAQKRPEINRKTRKTTWTKTERA